MRLCGLLHEKKCNDTGLSVALKVVPRPLDASLPG